MKVVSHTAVPCYLTTHIHKAHQTLSKHPSLKTQDSSLPLARTAFNSPVTMPFHDSYHLILSGPKTRRSSEDINTHLSLESASRECKRRKNPRAVCRIPKWVYHKKNGMDHVELEVPGIDMDNAALFVSNRDIVVSAMRHINHGNTRKFYCEYFFKMRLADDNDADAVKFDYLNGVLSILIPRMQKKVQKVKKLIPAFVYNKTSSKDEVMLKLVGVKSKDIKYDVKDRIITIHAVRYDLSDGEQTPEAEYFFRIRAALSSDLDQAQGILKAGIFTLSIPRKSLEVHETVPIHLREKKTGVDIHKLELPGVKKDDIKIRAIGKQLEVRANRFDEKGNARVQVAGYTFRIDVQENNDLDQMKKDFSDGILTLWIPMFPRRG